MSALLSAVLAAAAVLVLFPPRTHDRLTAIADGLAARAGRERAGGSVRPEAVSHTGAGLRRKVSSASLAAGLAGLCLAVVIGGPVGVAAGAAVAVATVRWLGRLEPAAVRRRRERLAAQLPLALDLLAACLAAGRPPADSLDAVAAAVGDPVAGELRAVSSRLALGADPASVWRALIGHPQLTPLARTMVRAVETGAPVAEGLSRLVDDQRRTRRWDAEQRARSVGVRAAAPLAVCFLPAFVAVGIVPTIASAFGQLVR